MLPCQTDTSIPEYFVTVVLVVFVWLVCPPVAFLAFKALNTLA